MTLIRIAVPSYSNSNPLIMKNTAKFKLALLTLFATLILSCSSTSSTTGNTDRTGTATSKDGSYGTGSGSGTGNK